MASLYEFHYNTLAEGSQHVTWKDIDSHFGGEDYELPAEKMNIRTTSSFILSTRNHQKKLKHLASTFR